jgi:general secretion pathway protein A
LNPSPESNESTRSIHPGQAPENQKQAIPMHEAFYQLSADPFRLSPDPRFCFQHRTYRKAMTYMHHALQRAEGLIMITGRPGTGKTTLINDLLRTLKPEQAIVANLATTQMKADDLLHLVAYSFNLDVERASKVDVLVRLERFMKQQYQQGRRSLLIVDEAQGMVEGALEELRLLTNIQVGSQPLLQVFLVGQEQLRDLVDAPAMEQLRQRIIAATHIESLDSHDTEAYIKHRLHRVGWTGDPLISKEAYALIQQYSQGIPRQINQICSRLFLHGSIEEKHLLGIPDVMIVVEELRQEFLMPMEKAGMAAAVSWPADHQETYEEEPPRQTAPAPLKSVPQPVPPTPLITKARQETEPSPDTLPEEAAAGEQETPLDQAEPEKKQPRKRSSWRLLLTGLVTGLALALMYATNPELTRQAAQELVAWVHSGTQTGISILTGESSPDTTEPDKDMDKGTVVLE